MKPKKNYWDMTAAELRETTRKYDGEWPGLPGKAPTGADRTRLAAARKRGRPPIGKGAEKIRISVERDLLKKADAAARRLKVSRSELIARGLRTLLKRAS